MQLLDFFIVSGISIQNFLFFHIIISVLYIIAVLILQQILKQFISKGKISYYKSVSIYPPKHHKANWKPRSATTVIIQDRIDTCKLVKFVAFKIHVFICFMYYLARDLHYQPHCQTNHSISIGRMNFQLLFQCWKLNMRANVYVFAPTELIPEIATP